MRRLAMSGRSVVCVGVVAAVLVAVNAREVVGEQKTVGPAHLEELVQPAVVSGKILRSDGGPVAGAKVTLYEPLVTEPPFEIRVLAETTSADDGTYRFAVAVGSADGEGPTYGTVVARKEGLSIGWASWPDRRLDRQRDITLTEPKDCAGTVVDGQGQPVEGAKVFAVGGQYERRPAQVGPPDYLYTGVARRLLTATTDAAGKFTVRGLPAAGRFELAATKAGYGAAYTWKPERPAEQGLLLVPGRTDLRMVMPPEARIEGKVVEKGSGKPIAGMEIASLCWRTSRLLRPTPVRSGADGAFVLAGLSPDAYVLRLADPREPPADWVAPPVTQEVKAGEVKRDVRIELSKGGLAEIVVTEANQPTPVPGAAIRVASLSHRVEVGQGVTKADGVAQIRLVPGEYRLQDLTKRGYTYSRPEDRFTVEEGKTCRVAWPVRRLPTVSGVVRDEAGQPLAGTAVRVQPMGKEEVLSDAQGRFRVAWDMRDWSAKTENYLVALDSRHKLAAVLPTIKDGNEVDLTLRPAATLVGQVVDINDRGIPGVEVLVMLRGPTWSSRLFRSDTITTDAQGRFEVRTIPPEQGYHITAMADGYGRTDIDVEKSKAIVGRVDLGTLHLAAANRAVSGIVVDPQGRPVPDASVMTVGGTTTGQRDLRTRTDTEGRFRLEGLCAGAVHLQASARIDGANFYTNVNTYADTTDVRIVLEKRN
jgi:protocatechuate 3,4-dioxygenase beta subunit